MSESILDTHVLIILNAYLKPLNPFIVVRRDSYNSTRNSGVSCDFALWQLDLWNLAGVGRLESDMSKAKTPLLSAALDLLNPGHC